MVDDGSTDGSAAIAERLRPRDARFRARLRSRTAASAARATRASRTPDRRVPRVRRQRRRPAADDAYELLLGALDRTGSDFATGNVQRLTRQGTSQAQFLARTFARTRLAHPRDAASAAARRPHGVEQAVPALVLGRARAPLPRGRRARGHPGHAARALRRPRGRRDRRAGVPWRLREDGARSITQRRLERASLRDRLAAIEQVRRTSWRARARDARALVRRAARRRRPAAPPQPARRGRRRSTARCSSTASTRCSTAPRRGIFARCRRSTGSSGSSCGRRCVDELVDAAARPAEDGPPRAAGPAPRPLVRRLPVPRRPRCAMPRSAYRLGRRDEDLALTARARRDPASTATGCGCSATPTSTRSARADAGGQALAIVALPPGGLRAARLRLAARRLPTAPMRRGDLGPGAPGRGSRRGSTRRALAPGPLGPVRGRARGWPAAPPRALRARPRRRCIGALDLARGDGAGDPAGGDRRRRAAGPRATSTGRGSARGGCTTACSSSRAAGAAPAPAPSCGCGAAATGWRARSR